jgi:hypothetical protein
MVPIFRLRASQKAPVQEPLSPPLAGGDKGEGNIRYLKINPLFTPTLTLPRQGGGNCKANGQTLWADLLCRPSHYFLGVIRFFD